MTKLRILVIDDNSTNIAKAIEQFSDSEKYQLTTISTYNESRLLLGRISRGEKESFDAILTDLSLPEMKASFMGYSAERKKIISYHPTGKEYPHGITLALFAMMQLKIKNVAIVTAWNHDAPPDPFISELKMLIGSMYGGSSNGVMHVGETNFFFCDSMYVDQEAYYIEPQGDKPKNWKKVLEILLAG